MSTRDASSFLHDVLMAIESIQRFTSGRTLEGHLADDLLRSAVERQLTIIGEAIAKLYKVDSPQIIAFRNRLIHDYGQVDHAIVWGVVSAKIPLLHERVRKILEAPR
jgi:uncharacterized protein with HEPN domain